MARAAANWSARSEFCSRSASTAAAEAAVVAVAVVAAAEVERAKGTERPATPAKEPARRAMLPLVVVVLVLAPEEEWGRSAPLSVAAAVRRAVELEEGSPRPGIVTLPPVTTPPPPAPAKERGGGLFGGGEKDWQLEDVCAAGAVERLCCRPPALSVAAPPPDIAEERRLFACDSGTATMGTVFEAVVAGPATVGSGRGKGSVPPPPAAADAEEASGVSIPPAATPPEEAPFAVANNNPPLPLPRSGSARSFGTSASVAERSAMCDA